VTVRNDSRRGTHEQLRTGDPGTEGSKHPGRLIWSITVTFNPERERFGTQIRLVQPQVDWSVVVDNGSAPETLAWLRRLAAGDDARITLIELGQNRGIAAAQNAGIAAASIAGADCVLLLDHDSLPDPAMVRQLSGALETLQAHGTRVAAVGPCYEDTRQNNPPPFIRVSGGRLHRLACPHADTVNEVDYLIASGSLIPMPTLQAVGPMNEKLFIDYVDIEWGLRGRQLGYRSFGICAASMDHDLGETPIRVFGRSIPTHSPIRHYYLFRNAVWLYRHSTLPRGWKFVDGYRLLLRLGFYALFARPRGQHLRAMLGGIVDGFAGRLGPASARTRQRTSA